jgi:hypothetical protein
MIPKLLVRAVLAVAAGWAGLSVGAGCGGTVGIGAHATVDRVDGSTDAGAAGSGSTGGPQGSGSAGATGGSPGGALVDGEGTLVDPHKEQRHALISQLCANFDLYPCLRLPVILGEPSEAQNTSAHCLRQLELSWYADIPAACWDDWVLATTCAATANYQCPCYGAGCDLGASLSPPYDGPCPAETAALQRCAMNHWLFGTVNGSRFSNVRWSLSNDRTRCFVPVFDETHPTRTWLGSCTGPPGGPYGCEVTLNGRILYDDRTQQSASFLADDCQSAAQRIADGFGAKDVDCCFTWFPTTDAGTPGAEQCSCTADPAAPSPGSLNTSYATCADAAAAGHGSVVDLCPYYAPAPNLGYNFPGAHP